MTDTQKVKVGMVGTSWWADAMYLPALNNHPHAQLAAICGRNAERAQQMANRWDIPQAYTDWQAMLDEAGLDALIVATGNDTHYPITHAALERDLHVLCEKPLTLTYDQSLALAKLASQKGVVHMVPFTYRFMPTARYLKELLDDGYIGTPYHLNMRYYANYAREGQYQWRFDKELAGAGVVGDLGSHWLYLAEWFFGPISTVSCQLGYNVPRPDTRPDGTPYEVADDMAIISLEFENGAYGVVHVSAVCYEDTPFGQTHHMEFHGSGGTLYNYTDWDTVQEVSGAQAGQGPVKPLPIPDHIWGQARRDTVGHTYQDIFREHDFMARDFISGIVEGRPVSPDFNDGARIQRLIEACLLSDEVGRRVGVGDFER